MRCTNMLLVGSLAGSLAMLSACAPAAPPGAPPTGDAAVSADSAPPSDGTAPTPADGGAPGPDGGSSPRDGGRASDAALPPADTGTGTGPSIPGCPYGGRPLITDAPLGHVSGRTESVRTGSFTDEYLYDATGDYKLGIRREWGSSVTFFGEAGTGPGQNSTNTIDANDTGREVQVALYDPDRTVQGCSWNASCARSPICPLSIRYLGWNPVQGGNRCNIGSPTESVSSGPGSLITTTVPLQWNPDWGAHECSSDSCDSRGAASRPPSDVRLTQTMRFVRPRVAELRYTVENLSDTAHAATGQEMPTMYTSNGQRGMQDLWRLMDPSGREVPIDTPSDSDGFMYENFRASGPWVSLQNSDLSYGVAILYENGLSDFQGWQKRSLPFNNVRSRIIFGLPARGTVYARAYLLVGSFATIQADAAELLRTMPAFGSLDAPTNEVSTGTVAFHGWALDNRGVVSVEARIDESVTVPMRYGDNRPDVCLVWPGYPGCTRVGYSGSYDFGAPTECPHLVEIIATDTDGNRRTIAERLVTVR
ncbi:MAG: hypothetical protein DRJ42_12115 [Deltaproteobacteria bacterium]|nr:MAG: hypothetical protein DRJ42_12115 [Deltaproteobacteria bacterium]